MPERDHHTYAITLTLIVSDTDEDGTYVVTDTLGTSYGDGPDPSSAVADYLIATGENMEDAITNMSRLGPGLRAEAEVYREWANGEAGTDSDR